MTKIRKKKFTGIHAHFHTLHGKFPDLEFAHVVFEKNLKALAEDVDKKVNSIIAQLKEFE